MSDHDNLIESTAEAQLEELLTAYADARLAPARPVLARMRANVVAAAAATAATAEAERRRREADRRRLDAQRRHREWMAPFGLRLPRRAVAFGIAATLTLGTSAAVIAATPGSPFYTARLAIEAAFLPNTDDARLAAHEQRLDQRLAEAQAAAASGNSAALEAALDAYQNEVAAAVADLGDDAGRLAHLEDVLGKHVTVLQALEATLPSEAAIQHAIDASQKAVDKLKDKGSHPAVKSSPAPHATRPPSTDGGAGQPPSGGGAGQP